MSWEEYKLKQENEKKLKLDKMDFDKIIEKIYDRIHKAEEEALRQKIENNTIVLNVNHAKVKEFYLGLTGNRICHFPPMLLGKHLITDVHLPDEYDFALTQTNLKNPYEEIEELKNLFRKYVATNEQSLYFKDISYKKNIEDFEKIKRILNECQ